MTTPEHGPFQTEQETWATQAAQAISAQQDRPYGRDGSEWRAGIRAASLKVITDECDAAGVVLGDYELRQLGWLAEGEKGMVVTLAGIIHRALEAGKAAGRAEALPEGTVTRWAVAYSEEGGRHTQPYDDEDMARGAAAQVRALSPDVSAVVKSCQVTPWTEAPETGADDA